MQSSVLTARLVLGGAFVALAIAALGPGDAAARSCGSVDNPYEGTRYDGVDLTRIRATEVRCPKARRVARRAHKKALGLVPDPSGHLSFGWNGWQVTGNLRPSRDRYRATRRDKRVRWRF